MQTTETKQGEQKLDYMLSDQILKNFFGDITDKKNKPVVLSLDYDNCANILFPYIRRVIKVCSEKNMEFVYQILFSLLLLLKYLDNQYTNINVVCGSARQTHATDRWNRKLHSDRYIPHYKNFPELICKPDEGYALKDFEKLVIDIKDSPNTKSEWNFWPLLFADGTKNPDGSDKKDGFTMSSKDENSTELDSQKMKTDLIKFQILRAKDKFKSDNFDFVFVDDRKDILGAIKKMLESKPEWLPPKVRVALYYYNWHERATSSLDKNALALPELFAKL